MCYLYLEKSGHLCHAIPALNHSIRSGIDQTLMLAGPISEADYSYTCGWDCLKFRG